MAKQSRHGSMARKRKASTDDRSQAEQEPLRLQRRKQTRRESVKETNSTNDQEAPVEPGNLSPSPKKKRKTKEEKEAEAMPLAARTVEMRMLIGAHVSAAKGRYRCRFIAPCHFPVVRSEPR